MKRLWTKRSWHFRYSLLLLLPTILLFLALIYLGYTGQMVVLLPGWVLVNDLTMGYSHDANFYALLLVSWAFWFSVLWTISEYLLKHYARAMIVTLIMLLGVGYLGFRTTGNDKYRFKRNWGLITKVTSDTNGDGKFDTEVCYPWGLLEIDLPHTPAQRSRSDQNHDGRWDTWIDYEKNTLGLDTNDDGFCDVVLEANVEGFQNARDIRGW